MKKLTILSVLLLALAVTSFGQSSKVTYSVASVADLSLRIPQPSEVIEVRHGSSSNLWPAPLYYTYVSNSTATVRFPYVRMPSTGVGRYESPAINNPVQDIRYWGAISGDGADDSASVQAALDWSAGNRRIFIPVGGWRFESPITLPYDYQEFDGGGFNANIQIAHNGNGFQHFGVTNGVPRRYNIIFRNIRMTTAAGFTPQSAFRLDDVSYSELDHVYVTQGDGVGFNNAVKTYGHYDLGTAIYGGNWGLNISFCQFWNKAGGDYVVWGDGGPGSTGGPNDIRILNSYISGGLSGSPTNGAAGAVFLQNCNMVRVENCDFEQYSTNGVWIGTNVQSASILNNRFENQGGTSATRRLIHFDEYTTQGHVVMGNMMLIQGGAGSIVRISGPGDSKRIPASIIDPSFEGPGQLFASTWLVGTNLDGVLRDYGPYGNKLYVMDRDLATTNILGLAVIDGTFNPRFSMVLRDSGDGTFTNSRVDIAAASSKASIPIYFIGAITNAVITSTGMSVLGLPNTGNAFTAYGSGMFGSDPRNPYIGGWSTVPEILGIRGSGTNKLALFVGTIDGGENRRAQIIEDPVGKTVDFSHGYTTGGGTTRFIVGYNVVMSMTDSLVTFPTNVVIMPGASITFGGVTRTDWPTGGGGTNSWKIEVNNAEVTEPSLDDTPTVSWDVTGSSIAAIVQTGSITTNHLNPAAIAFFASAANSALTGTPTVNGTNLMALLNAKIDSDPDLVAVSALTGTGLLARTGAGTYAERTLTGDAEITVANGNGVSGNPTLAIGAGIARVAAMAASYQPLHAVLTRLSGIGAGVSGDILYRDATGWTNLAKGSDGQVLKLASGLPAWGTDSTGGGGGGDVYTSSNNVLTGATNTIQGTLVASNAVLGATAIDSMTLGTPLGQGSGGVGATTAAGARTNLQLVPGVDVQAFSLKLLQFTVSVAATGDMPYLHSSGVVSNVTSTAAGRTLLAAVDAAAQRTALGLGTMATETAANYALLSGATFSGTVNVPSFPYSSAWSNSLATVTASNLFKKLESMPGGSNAIITVSSDHEIVANELRLTNTVGTGRIVRESAAGGGGGSTNAGRHLFAVHARDMFSGTNAAAQATDVIVGNGRAVARFSGSTDNERLFEGVIPAGANIAGGLKITVHFGSTNTAGSNVVWQLQLAPGTGTDPTTTTWNTAVKLTNALPGSVAITNAACNYADLAGITNRQPVIGRIMRDQGSASDTEGGGVDVRAVVLEILDSN